MILMDIPDVADQAASIPDRLVDIIARKIAGQLLPELGRVYATEPLSDDFGTAIIQSTPGQARGSL